MKKTTLGDIARELNISLSSVASAFADGTGNTRISEETRKRVLEAAKRLDYQSHAGARSLRTQRFDNIGYFCVRKAQGDYCYLGSILEGLSDAAAERGKNVVLIEIPNSSERLKEIPRALRVQCLDGLIISDSASFLPGFQKAVEASGKPVVYLNEKQPNNSVYVDDLTGGRMITEHLISQGFRRIAMLLPSLSRAHYSMADRMTGYLQVMGEAGLPPEIRSAKMVTMTEEIEAWFASAGRPEAIFCYNDVVALELQRALYRLRLRVPEDMAIAGCDGEEHALHSTVPLTTLKIPWQAMAEQSLRMVLDLRSDRASRTIPSVIFTPELVISESSGNSSIVQKANIKSSK